ncbi:hypothetical protein SUGI_0308800 [Cryptomeria japonica]|nr:hypothetical protein SUGI_0308800 [Cryptomeria japonica]
MENKRTIFVCVLLAVLFAVSLQAASSTADNVATAPPAPAPAPVMTKKECGNKCKVRCQKVRAHQDRMSAPVTETGRTLRAVRSALETSVALIFVNFGELVVIWEATVGFIGVINVDLSSSLLSVNDLSPKRDFE